MGTKTRLITIKTSNIFTSEKRIPKHGDENYHPLISTPASSFRSEKRIPKHGDENLMEEPKMAGKLR